MRAIEQHEILHVSGSGIIDAAKNGASFVVETALTTALVMSVVPVGTAVGAFTGTVIGACLSGGNKDVVFVTGSIGAFIGFMNAFDYLFSDEVGIG